MAAGITAPTGGEWTMGFKKSENGDAGLQGAGLEHGLLDRTEPVDFSSRPMRRSSATASPASRTSSAPFSTRRRSCSALRPFRTSEHGEQHVGREAPASLRMRLEARRQLA
jgi:hypothetical protein